MFSRMTKPAFIGAAVLLGLTAFIGCREQSEASETTTAESNDASIEAVSAPSGSVEEEAPNPAEFIRTSVGRLQQARREGAAIIFKEAQSGKFLRVQGSQSEPFVIELPTAGLSESELERAEALFAEFDQGGAETRGARTSFRAELGDDVEKAAELAFLIFDRVYQATDQIFIAGAMN